MTYQNGQIESALARVCRIPAADLGAFKGKLRHLRSLGIPKVESVGSGYRVQFSRFDALTMRLALELSMLGVKPSAVVELTSNALKHLKRHDDAGEGDDIFFVVFPKLPLGYTWAATNGLAGVANIAAKIEATNFVTINISRLIREMDVALAD
jgi:hypothetical protein